MFLIFCITVEFPIRHSLGKDILISEPNYNLYVRTIEYGTSEPETPADGGGEGKFSVNVKVQVKTIKEGRIREKIILSPAGGDEKDQMEVRTRTIIYAIQHGQY